MNISNLVNNIWKTVLVRMTCHLNKIFLKTSKFTLHVLFQTRSNNVCKQCRYVCLMYIYICMYAYTN